MRGIRGQWLLIMGSVALLNLLAIVTATIVVASYHMYAIGAREATARARAFAYRAGFAVLVGAEDPATARALVEDVLASPDTVGVELIDREGRSLALSEKRSGLVRRCNFAERESAPGEQVFSTADAWCVSVPVLERALAGTHVAPARAPLGRLRVASSTETVRELVMRLVHWIAIVGAAAAVVSAWLIWRGAYRVTGPLIGIVSAMRAFKAGDPAVRAELKGPEECVTVSRVYNELLDSVERQASSLESQVRQRTQELQDASLRATSAERYKSTLMAGVSHEMKTPLHIIEAHALDILNELEFVEGGDTARSHVAVILKQSQELSLRVSQVLELSRAESASGGITREAVDLAQFAEDVREKAEPLARRNRNTVEVRAPAAQLWTDRDKLLQIVSNLVANACKFTSEGRVSISFQLREARLEVRVSDTGRGIPEHARAFLGQEFWQGDMGEGRRFGGFGLGLSIVRRYTEMLGGTLDIQSEVGRGTSVTVLLPCTPESVESKECST